MALMFVAVSSFWIHEIRLIGPWSPIHLLSIVVLVSVPNAIRMAHAGNITGHRRAMQQIYILALVVTGLFTLLPGRTMHAVIFG